MSSEVVIDIKNLSLHYKLYPTPAHMALDVFQVKYLLPWKRFDFPVKKAIDNLSLSILRGERIGLIGRNGAGKSSLLKVLTGVLNPTSGNVNVNGNVQSLLTSGLGFDPNLTGRQNIESSLVYNGLSDEQFRYAVADIINFCELDDYIDQPIRTYSLGMQSRLAFAASTAIRPDILIIDEVLGAGDAYFINKCAARVKRLTESQNTTLILVSHSTSQILKFCDTCLWIDDGKIIESGEPMAVVKKYDKFINDLQNTKLVQSNISKNEELISRWESSHSDALIQNFRICNGEMKETSVFNGGDTANFSLDIGLRKEVAQIYPVIMAYNESGVTAIFCHGKIDVAKDLEVVSVTLQIDELNIGPGEYHLSVAIYKTLDLNDLNSSEFIDLIDRSFKFHVIDSEVRANPAVARVNYKWLKRI